ncbi:glycosyltransferase family 2 protein [Candidatus Nitrosotenuis cloacae]|uniref:glycosyltransferase family 2 protein n=1 Tax=Candidatus Nitrosotenuis cloacae TaxID=1603555 RepID=UPI00227F508F|nr:glycosyltransferase [Candidatus Nitrosotenuis cloacae]
MSAAHEMLDVVKQLQEARLGDLGRLSYIRHAIEMGKKVYNSDIKYVHTKYAQLQKSAGSGADEAKAPPSKPREKNSVAVRTHRCKSCSLNLALDDKVVRYCGQWYHVACFRDVLKDESDKSVEAESGKPSAQLDATITHTILEPEPTITPARQRLPKAKTDPVLVLLAVAIFSLLMITAYSMFSYLSIIAIGSAAGLVFYHLLSRRAPQSQYTYGRKGASMYSIVIMIMPFALGTIIAYDGYSVGAMSVIQTIFLWGLVLSFWQTMLFVPLAIKSVTRESMLREPVELPRMSVLVPAYNEEKVIRTTLEALLATDYPDKEIIAIDDGSKDDTLRIMSEYKDRVKVVHKENGGKASALNAGMLYATGSIMVILDADTIIGNSALRHIAKSFADENVVAVAGNIKIRNRINTLTWCQALEYLSGIQIMRRGLDYFGAITIVPGALGAFRKSKLEEAGSYHKETLVEDFDATIKVLRSGMVVSGNNSAIAYTQAPQKLADFYKQRKRWYRGNLQVLRRHSDILLNPRFGYLQRFSYPLLAIHMLVIPFASLLVMAFAVYQLILGNYSFVAFTLGMFVLLQYLLSAMAVRMDKDDKRMILYSVFLVIGYKQIVDILQLKAVAEEFIGLKAKWTSAQRVKQ